MSRNRLYLGFIILLALVLVPAWWLSVNNDNWLPPEHSQEINLNYLSDEFSPGDDLVIGLQMRQGFFTQDNMRKLSQLEEGLKQYLGADLISSRSALSATHIANNKNVIEVESFESTYVRGAFANVAAY